MKEDAELAAMEKEFVLLTLEMDLSHFSCHKVMD